MSDIRKPNINKSKMNLNSTVKFLNKEETEKAIKEARTDGVISSQLVSDLPLWQQEDIKQRFLATFRDDRSAYHKYMYDKEYSENMKAKEKKQIISDEEENKILEEYSKEKTNKLLNSAKKALENWQNEKKEVPNVVINFD